MKLILKMAWRNLWRNWRRSFITILAIVFATLASIAMRGIQSGTYDANIKRTVEMYSGYIQIQLEGYKENPTIRKSFKVTSKISQPMATSDKIEAWAPRVMGDGLVGFKEYSTGAAIAGIDPELESLVSNLHEKVNAGRWLSGKASGEIVLGYKLLDKLNAEIGDTIVTLTSGYDGSMGNKLFKIVGTTKIGMEEYDNMSTFIGFDDAQELMAMQERVNVIALKLNDLDDIQDVKQNLKTSLKDYKTSNDKSIVVLDWGEVMPEFKQTIEFDNASGVLYLGLLILIVAFGILNTMVMSITERFNEFGIMLAIGMKHAQLVITMFFEVLFLSLIGIIAGNLLGFGINYYLVQNPIHLGEDMVEMYEQFGFLPMMYSSIDPAIFINTTISIFLIALIVFIYPAIKLYKLEPLKGIRFT